MFRCPISRLGGNTKTTCLMKSCRWFSIRWKVDIEMDSRIGSRHRFHYKEPTLLHRVRNWSAGNSGKTAFSQHPGRKLLLGRPEPLFQRAIALESMMLYKFGIEDPKTCLSASVASTRYAVTDLPASADSTASEEVRGMGSPRAPIGSVSAFPFPRFTFLNPASGFRMSNASSPSA